MAGDADVFRLDSLDDAFGSTRPVNGLRPGTVVRVRAGVREDFEHVLGQLGFFDASRQTFRVFFLDGREADFAPAELEVPPDLALPGEGGKADSFDLILGPCTSQAVVAEEVSWALFRKGFCVLRQPRRAEDTAAAVEAVRSLALGRKLQRLPEEVEEHYLGRNMRATAGWLAPDSQALTDDPVIAATDSALSQLGALIQPLLEDRLGAEVRERGPALLSCALLPAELEAHPNPAADDASLGAFLGTWRRQVLKAVCVLGPGPVSLALEGKAAAEHVEVAQRFGDALDLFLPPGAVLLYRTDCFDVSFDDAAEENTCLLTVAYLKPATQMVMTNIFGNLEMLRSVPGGPPPPPGDGLVNVMSMATRIAANFDEPEAMLAGLMACTDGVREIPLSRFDIDLYYAPNMDDMQPWQSYCRHMSAVDGVELFANKEFDISPLEASGMDPRQRHCLEVGCKALAGIGITKAIANRKVTNAGFAVGTDGHEWPFVPKPDLGACGNSSNALGITANRFSFVFNMRGPNFVVDTACSASLYAAHYIKLSLIERRWDPLEFCLAVGTQLYFLPNGFIGCAQAHMLSPEGRCFTFNSTANGYQRGDGTNAFTMKYGNFRDERLGLFRGSNTNQDGRSASLTAPNGPAQEQCIWGAVREAQMSPPESTVWECHGTGTSLGDPIEVGAVRKVQIKTPRSEPLMIGTLKSNIGHLEGGAAMSAMMKCILQVSRCRCCPTNHLSILNAHLDHAAFNAVFQNEPSLFHYQQGHSQVSSFGFGGSNAHGIFWGECLMDTADAFAAMARKIRSLPLPEVRPIGADPADWDSDYPLFDLSEGDQYQLVFGIDDSRGETLKWVKQEPLNFDEEEGEGYSIAGNFDSWSGTSMFAGRVPGQYVATLEVPPAGLLEFRFWRAGDPQQALWPASPDCGRRSGPVRGPGPEPEHAWAVRAAPGSEVEVQLLVVGSRRSVLWLFRDHGVQGVE